MSKNDWQSLLEVYDRLEAEMIKSALEAQGIRAEIFQGTVGTLYPATFGPIGKVDVCVAPNDWGAAQAWLQNYQNQTLPQVDEQQSDSDQ